MVVMKCPKCGHEFEYNYRKNAMVGEKKCASCKTTIYVENRTLVFLLLAIVLIFVAGLILRVMQMFAMPAILLYPILFIALCLLYFGLQALVIKCFGPMSLYRVRTDDYYRFVCEEAEKKRKDKKNQKK